MAASSLTYRARMLIGPAEQDIGAGPVGNTSNKIFANDPMIWDQANTRLDLLDAATEDINFVGVSLGTYDPDKTKVKSNLSYARKCTIRCTAAAAGAHPVGTPVKYGTDGRTSVSDTDTIGWLAKASTAADTEWDILIDISKLGKLGR